MVGEMGQVGRGAQAAKEPGAGEGGGGRRQAGGYSRPRKADASCSQSRRLTPPRVHPLVKQRSALLGACCWCARSASVARAAECVRPRGLTHGIVCGYQARQHAAEHLHKGLATCLSHGIRGCSQQGVVVLG